VSPAELCRSSIESFAGGERLIIPSARRARMNGREIAVRGAMRFDGRRDRIACRVDCWDSLVSPRQAGLP